MTADFSAAPAFDAPFSQLPYSFAGSELLLYDGHLRGVFAPDLSTIGGVTLDAWVDAAQAAVPLGVDQNGYCNLVATLGFTCVACPMGGPDQCIHFVEHDMTFTALPGGSVVDIASDQRENHLCAGSCTDGADNDGDGLADTDPECNPAAWP